MLSRINRADLIDDSPVNTCKYTPLYLEIRGAIDEIHLPRSCLNLVLQP